MLSETKFQASACCLAEPAAVQSRRFLSQRVRSFCNRPACADRQLRQITPPRTGRRNAELVTKPVALRSPRRNDSSSLHPVKTESGSGNCHAAEELFYFFS